jgi:hypothetical protein
LRNGCNVLKIFQKFVTQELIETVIREFSPASLVLSCRKKYQTFNRLNPTPQMCYQMLAIHIRIIGLQVKSNETRSGDHTMRNAFMEAKGHFQERVGVTTSIGLDTLTRLTSIFHFGTQTSDHLSQNFQSVVTKLGEFIAGDEKLFHFTGMSGDVRLVPSKPDKIGLWFYELCTKLSCGLPYLLHFRLHTSADGVIKVSDVVKQWAQVRTSIGRELAPDVNDKTYLAFDSYYLDAESRSYLKEQGVRYSASVSKCRMSPEVSLVHGDEPDKIGAWSAIYNDITQELFTQHYDTQKGVGQKYNLSFGLIRSEDKVKVREQADLIPGYDVYKSMFECCDSFNRNLHDKSFPHKRGGRLVPGHFGRIHDFLFACILQNTFNLWVELGGVPKTKK